MAIEYTLLILVYLPQINPQEPETEILHYPEPFLRFLEFMEL